MDRVQTRKLPRGLPGLSFLSMEGKGADSHRRIEVPANQTVGDVGEFGLIEIIKKIVAVKDEALVVGPGDDTAAWKPTQGALTLATCDIQVQGVHFLPENITPSQLGRRAAAINLSDIAAMGGRPRYALVSLALPKETMVSWVVQLYQGLSEQTSQFGAAVIGGNLSATSGP
ncbi:MAG: thiL, partial [Dehalococcoidia bacterium]|nr:thiL [Dehalococcoidia bacterium]